MRLATWNVNSLTARMPRVTEWIEENQPDVLCLQETKQADDKFPSNEFVALGYESAHYGDGRWNGVALLSRVGLEIGYAGSAPPRTITGAALSRRRVAAYGCTRSTYPTAAASTTSSTRSSWSGWPSSHHARRDLPAR